MNVCSGCHLYICLHARTTDFTKDEGRNRGQYLHVCPQVIPSNNISQTSKTNARQATPSSPSPQYPTPSQTTLHHPHPYLPSYIFLTRTEYPTSYLTTPTTLHHPHPHPHPTPSSSSPIILDHFHPTHHPTQSSPHQPHYPVPVLGW